mgnify:CR=1 FL=1
MGEKINGCFLNSEKASGLMGVGNDDEGDEHRIAKKVEFVMMRFRSLQKTLGRPGSGCDSALSLD